MSIGPEAGERFVAQLTGLEPRDKGPLGRPKSVYDQSGYRRRCGVTHPRQLRQGSVRLLRSIGHHYSPIQSGSLDATGVRFLCNGDMAHAVTYGRSHLFVASYLRQRVQGSIAGRVCCLRGAVRRAFLTGEDRGFGRGPAADRRCRASGNVPLGACPSCELCGALAPRSGEILRPDRTIRRNVNVSIGYRRTVAPPDRPCDTRLRPVLLCLAAPTRAGWQGRCGMRKLSRSARCAGGIPAAAQRGRAKCRASRRGPLPRRPGNRHS